MDGLLDEILGSLGLLLGDLLLFNGLCELWTEMQVCDGDIIKDDVEVSESLSEAVPDFLGDLLSLSEQLGSVVASDY